MGEQRSLSLLILLLLTFQEMMPSEAVVCKSPSRLFHGPCLSSKNCLAICEKDGFKTGGCIMLKCVCAKNCKSGGGSGGQEPGAGPPGQGGDEPGAGPPGQGGDEPGAGPPEQGGGGEEPGEGPPEQGGGDGEEPVAHTKPPARSRKYLLPSN